MTLVVFCCVVLMVRHGYAVQPIIDICQERGIPFIDFANDPKYLHQDIYFKDGNYMNSRGADEFTKNLICCLKNEMLQ